MTTTTAVRKALDIAESICIVLGVNDHHVNEQPESSTMSMADLDFSQFRLPDGLEQQLEELGVSPGAVTRLSTIYMHKAEQLKMSSEHFVRSACSKFHSRTGPSAELMPWTQFQRQLFESHLRHYHSTLVNWREETLELVHSRVKLITHLSQSPAATVPETGGEKRRRQFKSEYLPLFEFAFEQDRFPSREDKKHLSRISGMSYRQVNVWFQNRRCRQPSRAKSHRAASTPKTFEEMKARLHPSVRAALSESTPFMKKLNPDLIDPPAAGAPVLMQNSLSATRVHEVIVLNNDGTSSVESTRDVSLEATEAATTPGSNTRAVSLGATDDGFASDERDDSSDEDVSNPSRPERSAIVKLRPSPPQNPDPLNPFRTSVHAFPTPYAPSQLTADPFVIEHHPWLRDPRTKSKKFIEPMPEAMEEIMGGFNHMEVDDPDATVNAMDEQPTPGQRIVSAGSLATWSSSESTAASSVSAYLSSEQSSISDAELASPRECTTPEVTECTSSVVTENPP